MSKVKSPYPKKVYEKYAEIYKALANAKRLEMLNIIKNYEVNVDELSEIVGIRKANTSQHLALLRHLGIVNVKRSGKNAFYRLSDPNLVENFKLFKDY